MCRRHYDLWWKRQHYKPRHPHSWSLTVAEVDEMAVERLVAGDRPEQFTSFERREAVRQLHQLGVSKKEIARRLGVHDRQVYRDLSVSA